MAVKVKLYKHLARVDGTSPVVIQVIHKGDNFKKNLFSINPKDWDTKNSKVKASHRLYVKYNEMLIQELNTVETRYLQALIDRKKLSHDYLFGDGGADLLLTDAIVKYINKLKEEKKFTSAEKCHNLIKKIADFSPKALVSTVDEDFMNRFFNHLLKFNAHNTAARNVNVIITVLKFCRKKLKCKIDDGAIEARRQPKPTTKDKLTVDELSRINALPLGIDPIGISRDSLLIAFYFRGMRISDVLTLRWENIDGNRLENIARKTDKFTAMEVLPPAMEILNKYKGLSKYCLPMLTMEPIAVEIDNRYQKHIEAKTTIINKGLKIVAGLAGINKRLTTHVARHTFAYLADQSGMTAKRIQDMLNHYDLETTQNYMEDLRKEDTLNQTMRGFVDGLGFK